MQVRRTRTIMLAFVQNFRLGHAGGIGVIGSHRQTPKILQQNIDEFKSYLENKDAPFGIDILMPQVGGSARKTNVCRYRSSCVQESSSDET